ncbi:MAG TPA: hypothetical protein VMU28_15200 [Terriglobales bacterium]|nr:hypothetical protein [Terriglobales bacterium]
MQPPKKQRDDEQRRDLNKPLEDEDGPYSYPYDTDDNPKDLPSDELVGE